MSENPYAPPESASPLDLTESDPESFWIEMDRLFLRDNATLPDVCLVTGEVEGVMTMRTHRLMYAWPWRYLSLLLIPLGVVANEPLLGFLGLLILLILSSVGLRSVHCRYCLLKKIALKRRRINYIRWGLLVAAIIWIKGYHGQEYIGVIIFSVAIVSIVLRILSPGLKAFRIEGGVAEIKGVHPTALLQLNRWKKAKQ